MFEDSAKVGKPPNSTESAEGQNDGFGARLCGNGLRFRCW